jgi:hypothetical protein
MTISWFSFFLVGKEPLQKVPRGTLIFFLYKQGIVILQHVSRI